MSFRLFAGNASLRVEGGELLLRNGEDALALVGEEFVLHLREGGESLSLPSSCFARLEEEAPGEIRRHYVREGVEAIVSYTAMHGVFFKRLRVLFKAPAYLEMVEVEARAPKGATVAFGGEGLPYFIDDAFFLGLEFPAADHHYENGAFSLREHPCETTKEYLSLPLAIGARNEGKTLSDTFRAYIASRAVNRHAPFRYVYGNWGLYDNMTPGDPKLDEALALRSVRDLRRVETLSGVKFQQYVMDAFWFKPGTHYRELDGEALPRGFAPLRKALREDGLDFGLWFDLNFREDHPTDFSFEDNRLGTGTYCLACPRVYEAMESAILARVKEDGLKALKIDFAFFSCRNPEHDHAQGEVPSKEKGIKNFIRLVKAVKEAEPGLVFYCYNGFTFHLDSIARVHLGDAPAISPYWSWIVDYVYCGDPRVDEIPTLREEKSLAGYTDSMIRHFHDSYFPLSSIDDHGTMIGRTGTIYYLGKETFRRSALLGLMRGERKLHLYGDLSLLDEADCAYLGFLSSLQKEADEKGWTPALLLGDPRKGEAYGYALASENEGFLSVFNPAEEGQSPVVSLPGWQGKEVVLETLLRNGEKAEESKRAFGQATVDLPGGDYLLLRFRVVEENRREEAFALKKGMSATLLAPFDALLALRFQTEEGIPLRSLRGIPDALSLQTAGAVEKKERWSGSSWCNIHVLENEETRLENRGEATIRVQALWKEER